MTRIVWLLGVLICSSTAFARVDHVIVVSIDGGKPASILKSNMPYLNAIVAQGTSTFQAETILPSVTLPSHVSMLTGVSPSVHKVTWNFYNPSKGPVRVPTVFSLAKTSGYSTALFAAKDKFKHLDVPGSLDKFSIDGQDAISTAQLASQYLSTNKPNLLFVHLPDSDTAGHSKGWESPEQLKALEKVDQAIGLLQNTITRSLGGKSYVLIVTADHGGTGRTHGSNSSSDKTIPWITWGNVVKQGHKITVPVNTMDTAATTLWLLELTKPNNLEGNPVIEAYN